MLLFGLGYWRLWCELGAGWPVSCIILRLKSVDIMKCLGYISECRNEDMGSDGADSGTVVAVPARRHHRVGLGASNAKGHSGGFCICRILEGRSVYD